VDTVYVMAASQASNAIGLASAVAALLSCIAALCSVGFTYRLLRQNRNVAAAQFLLGVDEHLKYYKDVHLKLRPGGDWHKSDKNPTGREWLDVEPYMGLFERVNVAMRNGLVPLHDVRDFYGYRIANLVANHCVRKYKLEREFPSWRQFIGLAHQLGYIEIEPNEDGTVAVVVAGT
jgi:hypothetical protein